MSSEPVEESLPPELEAPLRELLAEQPGLPMPSVVLGRITAAIRAEAATRATLASSHNEPTAIGSLLNKATSPAPVHQPVE